RSSRLMRAKARALPMAPPRSLGRRKKPQACTDSASLLTKLPPGSRLFRREIQHNLTEAFIRFEVFVRGAYFSKIENTIDRRTHSAFGEKRYDVLSKGSRSVGLFVERPSAQHGADQGETFRERDPEIELGRRARSHSHEK